jgi:hypothetical protein
MADIFNMVDTWNDAGTTFTSIKMNATDTASATGSLLMDLQVGGASKFSVSKAGTITNAGPILTSGILGQASSTSGYSLSFYGNGFWLGSACPISWTSGTPSATLDLTIGRRAAANLRFGAADAAAPVAQTLSVQSVVAGTTNTAGANLTITGSQGTGTGAGGSIIFQIAPAGSSGTAQNALSTALTINADRTVTADGAIAATGSTASNVAFARNGTPGTGVYFLSSANLTFAVNGAGAFNLSTVSASLPSNYSLGWLSGPMGSGGDTFLARDAANTLALRNGTNAQESRVYGSYTSDTNFQRMSIKTLRESSGALSGATYVTTIAIPAYANLIGVTTRVTTAVTGATTYDVGDGSDVDLWGAAIDVALGSQSQTSDFTAVAAVGAAATSRTVTLTANGSNFTGGVVEICLHYLTTEAD